MLGSAAAVTVLGYNVLAFGDFTSSRTEVNGSLTVAGDVVAGSGAVGVSLEDGFTGSSLVVGGSAYTLVFGVSDGTLTVNTTLPLNFADEYARLSNLSASFAGQGANGVLSGGVFTGTDATLNMFNITSTTTLSSTTRRKAHHTCCSTLSRRTSRSATAAGRARRAAVACSCTPKGVAFYQPEIGPWAKSAGGPI